MTHVAVGFKARTQATNRILAYYQDLFSWSGNPDRVMRKSIRKQRNPWMFRPQGALVPAEIPSDKAPANIQAAFDDCFGNDAKTGAVRLILHPYFKRWTPVQKWRIRDKDSGEVLAEYWRPIWMAMHPPVPEQLPLDYRGNPEMAHLKGVIGEYREPNKLDFLWIVENVGLRRLREQAPARCDTVEKANQWAATKVNENLSLQDEELERHVDSDRESQIHDHFSYYARLHINFHNRLRGSAQRTQTIAAQEYKPTEDSTFEANGHKTSIQARYTKVKRTAADGSSYNVRALKDSNAGREIEAEKTQTMMARADKVIEDLSRRRKAARASAGARTL